MSLVEVGRFARNEAYIVVGRLESEGIMALALDANASIADGSQFFIPVRVMVDDDDVDAARAILAESA
ncbi:putative signal transducing protein [Sphingomonas sp. 10B4]|uniref:putative signal transducing protein n=1 Tax=Sphingomonas sp. 10B4 TaxID=3048575 RepID=UPI002AB4AF22|nr:DUF2007 domain-containing protein [Sphingomonas sp. 10B4]MDY7524123.1 DUF2007 domain-containing protein [Sphingomonas sp. 10B4]MEB0281741.1 DUF2007 domain-containing protein [Sphingomonas sp. 10B4]